MTLPLKYDAARAALAECRRVDEVIAIKDEAERMKLYARQAKDRDMMADAAEIQVRAVRQLGVLLVAAKEAGQIRASRPTEKPSTEVGFSQVTLKDAGIDYKLSSKAQKSASISERAFEAMVSSMRDRIHSGAGLVVEHVVTTEEKQQRRADRERILGGIQHALPTRKFGVILADPEWDFEVYSRETGMDRHAANQYPVSSDEAIAQRDVASIAADDSVCGLWCTDIRRGLTVLQAWGFEYKSYFVWVKDIIEFDVPPDLRQRLSIGNRRILMTIGAAGTGFWNRDRDEIMLIGTRGKPPCPAQGLQGESVWFAARPRDASGKIIHSAKPECSLAWFDEHFPNLPKIELNRRGPSRPGWAAWGNEVIDPSTGEITTEAA